jgi:hypothetical protein
MAKQYMFDFSHFFCNHPVYISVCIYWNITFQETSSGRRISRERKRRESRFQILQSVAEICVYVRNNKKIEEGNSAPFGSLASENAYLKIETKHASETSVHF